MHQLILEISTPNVYGMMDKLTAQDLQPGPSTVFINTIFLFKDNTIIITIQEKNDEKKTKLLLLWQKLNNKQDNIQEKVRKNKTKQYIKKSNNKDTKKQKKNYFRQSSLKAENHSVAT